MSGEGIRRVLSGVRPVDWVLAGVLTALGTALMVMNVLLTDQEVGEAVAEGSMVHPMSSHSWLMVPAFALATLPVLWWRRGVVAATGLALVAVVAHDLLFGWVTRCGAGLPLAFVLAYLGAYACPRARALLVLGLGSLLTVAVLAVDATTGIEPIALALPVLLIIFGIGRAVRHRTAMADDLRVRTTQLRQLRDERAALEVAGDRAQLSSQFDGLLRDRLAQLTAAADSGAGLDPAGARQVLASIEDDSRRTMEDLREALGVLRGGDVALGPPPSVAHLEELLARQGGTASRLTVTGNPRSLPASVELSAYRIVEHFIEMLADDPGAPIHVEVRFDDDALEMRVEGPAKRRGDVRATVARAAERARLLGGSAGITVSRGRARAVAQLPIPT
jgi:hypothetical protein